jgi:hypothetical protein
MHWGSGINHSRTGRSPLTIASASPLGRYESGRSQVRTCDDLVRSRAFYRIELTELGRYTASSFLHN